MTVDHGQHLASICCLGKIIWGQQELVCSDGKVPAGHVDFTPLGDYNKTTSLAWSITPSKLQCIILPAHDVIVPTPGNEP